MRDHPRVCGENFYVVYLISGRAGSPPRVRGKHRENPQNEEKKRITPACAGKTRTAISVLPEKQDHPRVCGENFMPYHAPYFV